MSIETNKALVRRFFEVRDQGNTDVLDEILYEEATDRWGHMASLQDLKQGIQGFHSGFSDIHTEIVEQIAEGDLVATAWELTLTHTGEFRGVAATGKTLKGNGSTFHRFKDGKIIEHWGYNDLHLIHQKLGA